MLKNSSKNLFVQFDFRILLMMFNQNEQNSTNICNTSIEIHYTILIAFWRILKISISNSRTSCAFNNACIWCRRWNWRRVALRSPLLRIHAGLSSIIEIRLTSAIPLEHFILIISIHKYRWALEKLCWIGMREHELSICAMVASGRLTGSIQWR